MGKKNSNSNKVAFIFLSFLILALLFVLTFLITTMIIDKTKTEKTTELPQITISDEKNSNETTTQGSAGVAETTTSTETTTKKEETTARVVDSDTPGNVAYPSDDASWKLICVNRNRYIGSAAETIIEDNLTYVVGSGELMDRRAAAAYEKMYAAAKKEGIYLTPCSGYRSYSTQKRLYYEFYNEYIAQGYTDKDAHDATSRRRNPPGASEHNLGICMDIICASSSANFQNTQAYAWLTENAADYGFILRYPENKVDITGVKFEPWHWRYVGVENAASIKNSGLCLEEYLGLA